LQSKTDSTPKGLIIAAPASGSGKTTLTLGILRALVKRNISIAAAKVGPDYIDTAFLKQACRKPCFNLDSWAMSQEYLENIITQMNSEFLVTEGVMGLFDGVEDRDTAIPAGSTADIAAMFNLPIILVLNVKHQIQSVAAIAQGFANFHPKVTIAGLIINQVKSARHEKLIQNALTNVSIPVIGIIPSLKSLALPSRHLGLVQIQEHDTAEEFLENAADAVAQHIELDVFLNTARSIARQSHPEKSDLEKLKSLALPPLGQRIAVAMDAAFSFVYQHILDDWHAMGSECYPFSPLANEAPCNDADAVYLSGGYPELHLPQLAHNTIFREGMLQAARNGAIIYGECGGFMTLGEAIELSDGSSYSGLGLLPHRTLFSTDMPLTLGYRRLIPSKGFVWSMPIMAHEFHHATSQQTHECPPLFTQALTSDGRNIHACGLRKGNISGSFAHVIAQDSTRPTQQGSDS
jgi:cobyrinic acid a,c-diamide synthase